MLGGALSGLQHCNGIWRILVQLPVSFWWCLGTQPCNWASGNLLVKNVKEQQLAYGKRGCSMIMIQSWLLGSQITDKKTSFQVIKQQKKQIAFVWDFLLPATLRCSRYLAPISKSVSLCSAVPSFSEIISILSSGFHEEPQEYILKKNLFHPLFMDGFQFSQGYRATKRRQFTFYQQVLRC